MRATATNFFWAGVVGVLLWAAPASSQQKIENCAACHQSLPDARLAEPAKQFSGDIHAVKGFGCVACHGGDGADSEMSAMNPAKGYIGKPTGTKIVDVCGHCHSDARFMRQYNPALRIKLRNIIRPCTAGGSKNTRIQKSRHALAATGLIP